MLQAFLFTRKPKTADSFLVNKIRPVEAIRRPILPVRQTASRLPIFTVFGRRPQEISAGSGGDVTGAGVFVHPTDKIL
jgi:hypothetical protein